MTTQTQSNISYGDGIVFIHATHNGVGVAIIDMVTLQLVVRANLSKSTPTELRGLFVAMNGAVWMSADRMDVINRLLRPIWEPLPTPRGFLNPLEIIRPWVMVPAISFPRLANYYGLEYTMQNVADMATIEFEITKRACAAHTMRQWTDSRVDITTVHFFTFNNDLVHVALDVYTVKTVGSDTSILSQIADDVLNGAVPAVRDSELAIPILRDDMATLCALELDAEDMTLETPSLEAVEQTLFQHIYGPSTTIKHDDTKLLNATTMAQFVTDVCAQPVFHDIIHNCGPIPDVQVVDAATSPFYAITPAWYERIVSKLPETADPVIFDAIDTIAGLANKPTWIRRAPVGTGRVTVMLSYTNVGSIVPHIFTLVNPIPNPSLSEAGFQAIHEATWLKQPIMKNFFVSHVVDVHRVFAN